jgi:hypothetical protein
VRKSLLRFHVFDFAITIEKLVPVSKTGGIVDCIFSVGNLLRKKRKNSMVNGLITAWYHI